MKRILPFLILLPLALLFWANRNSAPEIEIDEDTPTGRMAFEIKRLADPTTGEIPPFVRQKEMKFAAKLSQERHNDKSGSQEFMHMGPWNVGGRTRALAIHASNTYTYFAGGVSGGLWKSIDKGASWTRVSDPANHAAVSCIVQDTRAGKMKTWYYGSGESIGNSASKSFSAYYRGSGMYKSDDGGTTWQHLSSTSTFVNKESEWDVVYAAAIDPSRNDSDIVFAALKTGIVRSNDGGATWSHVLKPTAEASFTDVMVSSTGVAYAIISSDATTGSGFWRSPDGLNWTKITPSGFPNFHVRTVFDIAPSNENLLYFYSGTPGAGANGTSLWKYEYLSGDGSGTGGKWDNLTPQIPDTNMNLFNGYCMVMKIKPDNPDVIFIGGNNLYRSLTGFRDTINAHIVGGYSIFGDSTYNTRRGYQHPDQQNMFFQPDDPDVLLSSTDGGIHKTIGAADTLIKWTSLNNGYIATQFYGIGIDHGTPGSNVILGGLQDQGTYWTNSADPTADWVSIRGSDGAYVAVEDGGDVYYLSTQYANIRRTILDSVGNKLHDVKVMPPSLPKGSGNNWLFVHPFTLDPVDNNIMYLPYGGEIWRNDNLAAADSGDLSFWQKIEDVGSTVTTISASESVQGDVFFGTSNSRIYRIRKAHTSGTKTAELISKTLASGGYTSCIAIDPNDNDKLIVVFSSYNVVSLWYTPNGGATWESIEGNLTGDPDPGLPDFLYYFSNGPSVRWAEIIPTETGNRYFVGTSIGLFSTNLLQGDSTVWIQEGANSIGNVVVDMLDYRASDHFLAVGTHGNGIYTTTVIPNYNSVDDIQKNKSISLNVFPNPVNELTNISFELSQGSNLSIELFDLRGRKVMDVFNAYKESGSHQVQLNTTSLGSGMYHLRLSGYAVVGYKRIVKP